MTRLRLFVFVVALGLEGGRLVAAEPVYQFDFTTDPEAAGWTPEKESARPGWRACEGASGGHCLDVSRGLWTSPELRLPAHSLYTIRFRSRGDGAAYWGLNSADADGDHILGSICLSTDPSDDWVDNEFALMTPHQAPDGGSRIVFWPIRGEPLIDDVRLAPATSEAALRIADRVLDGLPPLRVELAADRWYNLPKTIMALHAGRPLRIVVLGDSVANDFANSLFHLRIERAYPGTRITVINSVSGSATAGYYLEANRLYESALRYAPDLVIFTGAHLGRSVTALRELSGRIREQSEAEMLVITAQHVYTRWLGNPMQAWDQLDQASRQDGYCIFNLSEHWERYVHDSGQPIEWFQRDFIHWNDRARQIGARLAALFFAPTGAEKHPVNRAGQIASGDDPARSLRPATDAGWPPVVAEIVGTIIRLTDPVTPARAGVYRDAYFHVEYRVDQVLHGNIREPTILTVQPCLKDREPLPSAAFVKGERHRMTLAHWEQVPGWETQLTAYDDQEDLNAVRYLPVQLTQKPHEDENVNE